MRMLNCRDPTLPLAGKPDAVQRQPVGLRYNQCPANHGLDVQPACDIPLRLHTAAAAREPPAAPFAAAPRTSAPTLAANAASP